MWTTENRRRYDRGRAPLPEVDVREVLNGIMYVLSTGCQWRSRDLPPRSTLNDYLQRWDIRRNLRQNPLCALYQGYLEQVDRKASPTACIIDSQSVKSAEKGGACIDPKGYDAGRRSVARSDIFWSTPRAC